MPVETETQSGPAQAPAPDQPTFHLPKRPPLALPRRSDTPPPGSPPSFQTIAQRRGYDPFSNAPRVDAALQSDNPFSFDNQIKSRRPKWGTVQDRIDQIEYSSGGRLPTDLSLSIAESNLPGQDLHRAAMLYARELSTPLINIFPSTTSKNGNRTIYMNPVTGKPLTLSAARRLYKPYERKYFENLIKQQHIDPSAAAAWFRALGPVGDNIAWSDALGMSFGLADKLGTDKIPSFSQNLKLVASDPKLTNPATGKVMSEKDKVGLAFKVAQQGITFQNGNDVMTFLLGSSIGPEPEAGTPEHAAWAQRRATWESWNKNKTAADLITDVKSGRNSDTWRNEYNARLAQYKSQFTGVWSLEEMQKQATQDADSFFAGVKENVDSRYGPNGTDLTPDVQMALDLKSGKASDKLDYDQMTQQIIDSYHRDEFNKHEQLFNRWLADPVSKAFDVTGDLVNTALWTVGTGIGVTARLAAMPVTHESFGHLASDAQHYMDIGHRMLWSEHEGGDQYGLAVGLIDELSRQGRNPGLPWHIVANLTELGAQVALDPTNFLFGIGKFQKAARIMHEAGAVDEAIGEMRGWERVFRSVAGGSDTLLAPTFEGRITEFLTRPMGKLDGLSVPDWLIAQARKYKDAPENFYDAVAWKFRNPLSGEGIPPQIVDAIHQWVGIADKHGFRDAETLTGDVRDILSATFNVRPNRAGAPNALADIINGINEGRRYGLTEYEWARNAPMAKTIAPHFQPWMTDEAAVKDAETLGRKLWNYWDAKPGDVTSMAIPQIKGLSADARAAVGRTMMESWFGSGIRYRRSIITTMAANLEENFPGWVENYMNRSKGLFSRNEVARWFREAGAIADPFANNREGRFIKFLENLQEEVVMRTAKKHGLSDWEVEQFLTDTRARARELNRHLYGISDTNVEDWNKVLDGDFRSMRDPQFVTQLPNVWMTTDPVRVEKMIQEGLGYKERTVEMFRKVFGKEYAREVHNAMSGGASRLKQGTVNHLVNSISDYTRETLMRYWKTGVVATPRYLFRVPLGDEQLRFIADAGVLGWAGSRKYVASAASKLGAAGDAITYDIRSAEYFQRLNRAAGDAGFNTINDALEAEVLRRAGAVTDPLVQQLDGLDPDVKKIVNDTIDAFEEAASKGAKPRLLNPGEDVSSIATSPDYVYHVSKSENLDSIAKKGIEPRQQFYGIDPESIPPEMRGGRAFVADSPDVAMNATQSVTNKAIIRIPREDVPRLFPDTAPVEGSHFARTTIPTDNAEVLGEDGIWRRLDNGQPSLRDGVATQFADAAGLKVSVHLPRPGELLDEEAVNAQRATSVFVSHEGETKRLLERMRKWSSQNERFFDEIAPTEAGYTGSATHVLVNQMGRDPLGSRVLRRIAQGWDSEEIQKELVRYMARDEWGRNIATRLGLKTRADLEQHAEIVDRMVRELTMGDEGLATAALKGDSSTVSRILDQWVANDPGSLHSVHGFKTAQVLDRMYPGKFLWDTYTKAIFELPTNKLSRQPFFKHWYTTFREGLLRAAKDQGLDMTPELLRNIEAQARYHAIERTQSIMFDFRRQSRFGEMLWFVAPFYQPWAEAFQVWGKLLVKNPQFANRARIFYNQAVEKGWIGSDPVTGEKNVPLSNLWFAAPLLNMAFGGFGGEGFGLSGPLNSFNFVFGSMFEMPTGKLAGNIPLPVPSLNPSLMIFGQQIAKSDIVPEPLKWSFMNWAFQYGDQSQNFVGSLLPTYMQHIIRGAKGLPGANLPGVKSVIETAQAAVGGQDILKSQADDFLRLYEAQGMTPIKLATDPEFAMAQTGQKFKSVEDAQKYLADKAMHQAGQLSEWRAVMSLFFPTAPSLKFPTQELELKYRQYVEDYGYDKGRDEFLKDYPQYSLITIPTTYWNRPDSTVPLPANKLAAQILNAPGAKEFAKQYPQWAFALLPNEVWKEPFDRSLFFQQMASGDRSTRGPLGMFEAQDSQAGWQLYMDAKLQNLQDQEALRAKGISESDPSFEALQTKFNEYTDAVKTLYPGFAAKINTFDVSNLDPWVEFGVDKALKSDLFKQTNVGQFLLAYRALRADTMDKMEKLGLHTLKTPSAEKYGVKQAYDAGVKDLIKQFGPDAKKTYNYFFRSDLQAVQTKGDRLLSKLANDPEAYKKYLGWAERWNKQRMLAANQSDPYKVSEAYVELRRMSNDAYQQHGEGNDNPLVLWWNTRTQAEKDYYAESVKGRPYVFLSRFDRTVVLGEKTNNFAEKAWLEVGRWDVAIAKVKSEDPNAVTAPLYEARDRAVAALAKADPVFAKQVEHANTWGWTAFHDGKLESIPGREGEAWRALHATIQSIQEQVVRNQLHGESDYGLAREVYREARQRVLSLVEHLKDYSPDFEDDWLRMEASDPGPDLLNSFFPETWYKLGGY